MEQRRIDAMKIAVPVQDGSFCAHFGGADGFALYTVNLAKRTIGERVVGAPPEHGRGVYPSWLRRQGASVVLAGGMGPRAVAMLEQAGIEVVLGVDGGHPDALVQGYLDGTLRFTGQPCHDQGYHDCGHDHGEGGRGGGRDR
jgi:predicted Fe-Mo cluster-binding NifX family protein